MALWPWHSCQIISSDQAHGSSLLWGMRKRVCALAGARRSSRSRSTSSSATCWSPRRTAAPATCAWRAGWCAAYCSHCLFLANVLSRPTSETAPSPGRTLPEANYSAQAVYSQDGEPLTLLRAMQVVIVLLLTLPCFAWIPCMIPDCFQVMHGLDGPIFFHFFQVLLPIFVSFRGFFFPLLCHVGEAA